MVVCALKTLCERRNGLQVRQYRDTIELDHRSESWEIQGRGTAGAEAAQEEGKKSE